jgi:hypothetical protein
MRTCTVMTFTDGTTSRFKVMRGPMRGRLFNAHAAGVVATYERTACTTTPDDYTRMTVAHATKAAPPVRWQAVLERDRRY